MIQHIVMWKFKQGIRDEEKERLKADMKKNLESLPGQVPGLISLQFLDSPLASSTHDMALISTLEKEADLAVYAGHPAHVKVADRYVRPFVTQRACLDYSVME